jgi:aminoglycoside phosphotransferase (APT) family kinase protein
VGRPKLDAAGQAALGARIEAGLGEQVGLPVEVTALSPLGGGACQELFSVDLRVGGEALALVLRCDAPSSLPGSLRRAAEVEVARAAWEAGVKTARPRWLLRDLLRPGSDGWFMDRLPGLALGGKVVSGRELAGARAGLPSALAAELARIHRLRPGGAPPLPLPQADPVEQLRATLDGLAAPRLALELTLRWLRDHRPAGEPVTLVHGDFRVGNLLVSPRGLEAVLDWEFAHWGTPAEDLAWLCVRDWRFGRVELAAGGLCSREALLETYAAAGGEPPGAAALRWWEVMGNARWAAGSRAQGERYLAGDEDDIELLAIARRAAEMEFEALRLIEEAG